MMTPKKIIEELSNYNCTYEYHEWPYGKLLLTDGAKAVADLCEAHWLIDAINCIVNSGLLDKKRSIIEVEFKKVKLGGDLTFSTNKIFHKQEFNFTTFPLNSIKFYMQTSRGAWVLFLPSEY